ncbi:MAG: hypothetical protein HY005_03225 [Candidatus Staskawiczbacteria bacterium]|nr:hypothetical protein [Candidatus Staskawiczbacteria bacterium]
MVLFGFKNVFIIGIVAFLAISFWSLYSMPTDENGIMVNCPFMSGSSSFCQMSVPEHINQWRQLFAVIQEKSLLLLLSVLLVFLPSMSSAVNLIAYNSLKFQLFRNYFYWYKPEVKLFDRLVVDFSQGNIHPKIYA